jgi:hypothetical protein
MNQKKISQKNTNSHIEANEDEHAYNTLSDSQLTIEIFFNDKLIVNKMLFVLIFLMVK